MEIIDISGIPQNYKAYGGASCRKVGITFQGKNYLMKLPGSLKARQLKNIDLSYSNGPICEYIGSHIYEFLDIPVHHTMLAMRDDKIVVLCEDFLQNGQTLFEFNKIKVTFEPAFINSKGEETDGLGSSLPEALLVLGQHPFFRQVTGATERFWEMFVVDAFIGNPDRNNGNWGVISTNGALELAPVYDNGNCLNDKWDDLKMQTFLQNESSLYNEAYKGNVCYYTDSRGKKINPFQLIASGKYVMCTNALHTIISRIQFDKIESFLQELSILTSTQREYYLTILKLRLQYLQDIDQNLSGTYLN